MMAAAWTVNSAAKTGRRGIKIESSQETRLQSERVNIVFVFISPLIRTQKSNTPLLIY